MNASLNQSVLDFLLQSDAISTLYFQYANIADGLVRISTTANEINSRREFIDGSRPRELDFTFTWYKSLSVLPVLTQQGVSNENVADLDDVQAIIDWIDEQNDAQNFPDLGEKRLVERMFCLSDVPRLAGVDTSYSPALARYTFTIRVEYVDYTYAI